MARITDDQRARLFSATSIGTRADLAGEAAGAESTKDDRNIYRTVDSAKIKAEQKRWKSHRDIETTFGLPDWLPATVEESGLVDPDIEFDESQQRARKVLHESQMCALMGAAGSGKTTMVKQAVADHIYGAPDMGFAPRGIQSIGKEGSTLSIVLCAFTGKATQVLKDVMPEWLHPSVQTIHSLLEYKPVEYADQVGEEGTGRFVPTRTAANPLTQNVIYIDEASMVGIDLWHKLLDACKPGTKIICIGDLNQLVPVADQPFYAMALNAARDESDGWNLAELTKIHRQKEPGANRIIDTAHAILNGKRPTFDFELNGSTGKVVDSRGKPLTEAAKPNPDWRVVNIHLDGRTDIAHKQIVQWLQRFEKMTIRATGEPAYNPRRDLLLTAGNGAGLETQGALVQQIQLNDTMADIFMPGTEENPTYFIDAGRETRKYTVGDRVMCNANESPDVKNRVTNGMMGEVIAIGNNARWRGDANRFGILSEVKAWRNGEEKEDRDTSWLDSLADLDTDHITAGEVTDAVEKPQDESRQASHIVTVRYVNGEERAYASAAGVMSTQLGYAVTTHKAQGSQAETVFVVCHGSVKSQLNREWLYTAVTRAQKRLVIFSTDMGMRTGLARQQLPGSTLSDKIDRYSEKFNAAGKYVQLSL